MQGTTEQSGHFVPTIIFQLAMFSRFVEALGIQAITPKLGTQHKSDSTSFSATRLANGHCSLGFKLLQLLVELLCFPQIIFFHQ